MKMKMVIFSLMLTFLVGGLSGCFDSQATDFFNGAYAVTDNTLLDVITFNGEIEISVWDSDVISFNAVKKSQFGQEDLDKVDINVIESENQIDIEAKYVGMRSTTPSVDMNIKVPQNVILNSATTSNGEVHIFGVKGNMSIASSNDDILIEKVNGFVSATTSNGDIDIKETTGIGDVKSSNGGIYIQLSDFEDDISISTSNGRIDVYLNPALDADIEMTTSNGQISLIGISLNVTKSEEKYVAGMLGTGGKMIDIHTSNGDINLRRLED